MAKLVLTAACWKLCSEIAKLRRAGAPQTQKASDPKAGGFLLLRVTTELRLGWSAVTFLVPAFVAALRATRGKLFLPGVKLRLLVRSQDIADLGRLLGTSGVATLHHLAGLLRIGAESDTAHLQGFGSRGSHI